MVIFKHLFIFLIIILKIITNSLLQFEFFIYSINYLILPKIN
jgi:hypothetical protein